MSPLKKFARLSRAERQLLCTSCLLTVALRLLLFIYPFKKTLALVRRQAPPSHPAAEQALPQRPIIRAVRAASRRVAPRDRPGLAQALVLLVLFRRHGHPAELRIGVSKNDQQQLHAHAWVESDGRVVIGDLPDLDRYTPLPSLEQSHIQV